MEKEMELKYLKSLAKLYPSVAVLQVREAGFPVFPKVINSVFVNSLHFWILALKTA